MMWLRGKQKTQKIWICNLDDEAS